MSRWRVWFTGFLFFPVILPAAEEGWERDLAARFSGRLGEIERELRQIHEQLPNLPTVPVADQGGTGGFAGLHGQSAPPEGEEYAASIRFPSPGTVDLVVLVPARRYGISGLDPQFGLPDSFTVELLDSEGRVISKVSDLEDVWSNPVRAGHPFVLPLAAPVAAAGLKISARKLKLDSDISETFVHAWSEAFAFEGGRNLALNGEVKISGGRPSSAPWQWSASFLADGQTTLGLPEIPTEDHKNVGWMTEVATSSDKIAPVWLDVDLGEIRKLDEIRLFPAKRPTIDLPSGFGFPRNLAVLTSAKPFDSPEAEPLLGASLKKIVNPGHNPVSIRLGNVSGRYVRINVTEPWRAYDNFPAFVALSEVEILMNEQNLALNAPVKSSSGAGSMVGSSGTQIWDSASLTDGYGADGKLVPDRAWLLALDKRLGFELTQHQLRAESQQIVDRWHRAGLTTAAILGAAALVSLVALPIRYRFRGKRQLAEVRDRIAGDLHDEVGSNLGSIQMLASVAEERSGESSELKRIQRIAAETVSAVRDIVWLLRPDGERRIATAEHLRETCSIMLEAHEWKFTANEAAWECEMRDDANRHLFLFFREALHNILRHSGAAKVEIDIDCIPKEFRLSVTDDGRGISPERLELPSTLRALRKRAEALDAAFSVESQQGKGTKLGLVIPLGTKTK